MIKAARRAEPAWVHRDTIRSAAFSDGVLAITITLLVLEIRPPIDDEDLLHGLVALWPSYPAYAVTFLFIGQVRASHQVMFDHIRAADRLVLLLQHAADGGGVPSVRDLVLARALRTGHGQRTAAVFYGIASAADAAGQRHHPPRPSALPPLAAGSPLLVSMKEDGL